MAKPRTTNVTDEMLRLYERGLELQAAGHDDLDDDSPEHDEFKRVSKRLSWDLLHNVCISVFDRSFDADVMPRYMIGRPIGEDWTAMRQWRKALDEARQARRKAR